MRNRVEPNRLRYAREQRGLTLRQLGDKVGVSIRTLQRYEQGDGAPKAAVLDLLALHLGVSPDYLQGKVEGMTSSRVSGDLVVRHASEEAPAPGRHEGEGDGPSELAKIAENVAAFGSQLGETMQEASKGASSVASAWASSVQAAMASSALSPRLMELVSAMTPPPGREKLTPMELAEQILAQTPEEIEAVLLIVRVQMARMGLPWPGAK